MFSFTILVCFLKFILIFRTKVFSIEAKLHEISDKILDPSSRIKSFLILPTFSRLEMVLLDQVRHMAVSKRSCMDADRGEGW